MQRNQIIAIVVIVIVVASSGILFVYLQQPSRPPVNVHIYEVGGNPESLDPHVDYETLGSGISYNVYETLYTFPFGTDSSIPSTPLLAAGAPVLSADGQNYTITLREGVTFHDGTPFNASCVKWNIERAMKIFYPSGPVWMIAEPLKGGAIVEAAAFTYGPSKPEFKAAFDSWVAASDAIEIINNYTIRFILEDPYPPFIAALTYEVGSMLSPSYCIAHASDAAWASWGAYGVDYGEFENWMNSHTCGTGPYQVTEWLPDQYVHLVLYDEYWRTDETEIGIAPPSYAGSLQEVYIKVNDDVSGRCLRLRVGQSDACTWPTTNALEIWDPVAKASLDSSIHVSTGALTFTVTFFGFNMGTFNTSDGVMTDSPFSIKEFRLATSYVFDYDAFIQATVNGIGIQAKGPVPQGMLGHNGSMYTFEYNIDLAVDYWNLAMSNPAFVDILNAMNNRLMLYYPSASPAAAQGALILADGFRALLNYPSANRTGLDKDMIFTTQGLEFSNYLDHLRDHQMPIFFLGWAPDYADPDNYIFPFCYEYGVYAFTIGYNNTNVNLWYKAAKIETNMTARQKYFDLIQEAVADDCPYIWVLQTAEFRTWKTWLKGDGLTFNPMHDSYWFHMYKDYTTT